MSRSQRPVWLGEDGRGWDHARIHRQLLEDGRLGVYEIGIYVGLAIHAETMSGSCRPAAATLAKYVKCGERRAREALDRLEEAGYIRVEVQVGKASTYHLLRPPTLAPGAGVPDADPGTSSTDPGTTTRTTPAPRADEREPGEREPVNEGVSTPVPVASTLPAVVETSPHVEAARDLCSMLADSLERRGERINGKAHSPGWVRDMEAMLRLEGKEPEAVAKVIRWLDAGTDDTAAFWRVNVRSPAKLRAKWTQMGEDYARRSKPRTGGSPQDQSRAVLRDLEQRWAES